MAEEDNDRASELESEREAEIESEMERVGQNPEQVDEGTDHLGTQHAASGSTREGVTDEEEYEQAITLAEEEQTMPNDQQTEQWAESGGDEELAEEVLGEDEGDEENEENESTA